MPKIVPTHYRQLIIVFEKAGFIYSRTKGDHVIYTKIGNLRPLVIPKYKQIPVFIIRNLLRTANISRDKYFKLLKE